MTAAASFLISEVLAFFVFVVLSRKLSSTGGIGSPSSIAKGIVERLVLYVGLLNGFATVLVLFGALKIATRLKDQSDDKVSNDYFLIGNLVSVLIVIIALAIRKFLENY